MLGQVPRSKAIEIVKSLSISCELLLKQIKNLSRAIGRAVDDLQDLDTSIDKFELSGSLRNDLSTSSASKMRVGLSPGMLDNNLKVSFFTAFRHFHLLLLSKIFLLTSSSFLYMQKPNGTVDFGNDLILNSWSMEELLGALFTLGNHLSFLWNAFLKFHRYVQVLLIWFLCYNKQN